eukprot:CAMPEP_0198325618 /NCGR_PEP_ID=MMETSP1450-20131203/13332_1 /TAXON_ID=753684 ORGANISM="Madagascaria erythrocladiodes, Strain CCMP3234" /NCGR_SAMPLE_ID=MMETSP1450 /ASSEMBLY_ACC=CAM_ASM_001115 /LENGTH=41 /DNA_ID= /DNA_START= /DNA_END= /DNA_ORIENTATION=
MTLELEVIVDVLDVAVEVATAAAPTNDWITNTSTTTTTTTT